MKTPQSPDATVSDADLIAEVKRLAAGERAVTTALLRSLMEFDARRLYLGEGYPSLFAYCTQVLHYAEHAALNRIEVARAAKRLPVLLQHVAEGALNITGARLLAPHLTKENAGALFAAARHKSKREIEELIAVLRPRPVVAPMVRKLPSPRPPTTAGPAPVADAERSTAQAAASPPPPVMKSAPPRAVVAPLAPERFKVQFTITRETRDKLRQVQDLMRHARHVPAAVRRTVWQRDGGCCAFVGSHGRCGEHGFLEFHHVVPFAVGGAATVENIELRCRAHNAYEASLFFGAEQANVVREVARAWGTCEKRP